MCVEVSAAAAAKQLKQRTMENPPPDPLLKSGSFIDPIVLDADSPSDVADPIPSRIDAGAEAADWLPPGWQFRNRVRTSGASVGHKDKYYFDPVSKHWFRSKKEVLAYLKTGVKGSGKKKKDDGFDDEGTTMDSKRKKTAQKVSIDNFRFSDAPGKMKWVMTDVYEGSWRPVSSAAGGTDDMVPESTQQEWAAAYKYLTLQKNTNAATPKPNDSDA